MKVNWKTSLLGLGAGFLNLLAHGMSVREAAVSIALTALGVFAKDHDK